MFDFDVKRTPSEEIQPNCQPYKFVTYFNDLIGGQANGPDGFLAPGHDFRGGEYNL